MKIIIVSTAYPLRGGIAHYNALLASALGKRHQVETITFKRQYPKLLFPGKMQDETAEGHRTTAAPQLLDSINPINWFRVANVIRRRKPDLLIFKYWLPFFGPCFGTVARLAKRGTSTKVLFICDNIIPHERRPGDVAFTRYAFKQADYLIVQSDAVERDLKTFWPQARYRNVPHPIYSLFGEAIVKQDARKALDIHAQNVVLFFGYIRAYKGLHVLLNAMARLVGTLDVHLLVVGEFYDDEQKYRKQIAALNLEKHVTLYSDYIPNNKVHLYFSAADVVVLPYLSATQSGITQIAYNFDKPVIATDVGGLSEVVLDGVTGFIVPPNDAERLAQSIRRYYDEKKENTFVADVRKEKQKYSWDNLVRSIEELVEHE
jgi:glycosyltransferase involved in cell wall biosynthesis